MKLLLATSSAATTTSLPSMTAPMPRRLNGAFLFHGRKKSYCWLVELTRTTDPVCNSGTGLSLEYATTGGTASSASTSDYQASANTSGKTHRDLLNNVLFLGFVRSNR